QCHVPQKEVKPLVDNSFETIDKILQDDANATKKP
ncbi:MAG: cytochrome C, partial [Pseudomonas sp.]